MKTVIITGAVMFCQWSILQVHGQGNTSVSNPYSNEGCNMTRGCFLCDTPCGANIAWQPFPDDNRVRFNLWSPQTGSQGFIAMGLSLDREMPSSDVYACVPSIGGGELQRYRTATAPDKDVAMRALKGVANVTVQLVNNIIRCEFYRDMSLNDGDAEFYDIGGNNEYHILLASGPLSGNNIGYHGSTKASSGNAIDLSRIISAGAGIEDITLMQVHGCLMVIAWIGLASIGITLARYFKPMWPTSTLCGVKIWFAIHRACMVTAWLTFLAAFIIIFVHVRGFVTDDQLQRYVHGILGVIATFLGFVNPIMALFRPHPGTPNRPIFNWAHWSVGTLGHLLAMVTVLLALAESTLIPTLPTYTFWIMVCFAIFHFIMWGLFEVQRCIADSAGRSDDIPLSGKHDPNSIQVPEDSPNPSGAICKMLLLFIYSLGVVFVVLFLVISIALVPSMEEEDHK